MNAKQIHLPETVGYTPLHTIVRTKKIGEKKFCATGAWYFAGERGMYASVCAASRRSAVTIVSAILEHGENWKRYIGRDVAFESERHLRAMGG